MKKGFTLIELLAVIVILAVIALIATPVVLNIISDTKNSATLRSAEFYLDALEMAIPRYIVKGGKILDGTYDLIGNGNICLEDTLKNHKCEKELPVEVSGEIPNAGSTVTIESGKIKDIVLKYNDNKTIIKNDKNEFGYLKYKIGEEVTFDPGDGSRNWIVIDEDVKTVTLLLTENLESEINWYEDSNNSYGPINLLTKLNSLTISWDNVEKINNYTYINNLNGKSKTNGYQKLEIKEGKASLISKDGKKITNINEISKARILTNEELLEIASKIDINLAEKTLEKYIEDNLYLLIGNEEGIITIDDLLDEVIKGNPWLEYESKHLKLFYTVLKIKEEYFNTDFKLPAQLINNNNSNGYWTLSSYSENSDNACFVGNFGYILGETVSENLGLRPVITISKTKIFK